MIAELMKGGKAEEGFVGSTAPSERGLRASPHGQCATSSQLRTGSLSCRTLSHVALSALARARDVQRVQVPSRRPRNRLAAGPIALAVPRVG